MNYLTYFFWEDVWEVGGLGVLPHAHGLHGAHES